MGRKRATVGKPEGTLLATGQEVAAKPVLGDHSHLPRTYANFLYVSSGPSDFMLVFGDMEPPREEVLAEHLAKNEKEPIVVTVRPVVKVVLPNEVVGGVIEALTKVHDAYRARSGKQEDSNVK